MFMHSGSPKRALNSITFTPPAVAKKPLFITPLKWRPCAARRSITRLDDRARLLVVGRAHERQRRRRPPTASPSRPSPGPHRRRSDTGSRRSPAGRRPSAIADRLDRELGADDLLLDQHRLAGRRRRRAGSPRTAPRHAWSARCGPITFTPLPPVRPAGLTATGVEPKDAIASPTSRASAHDPQQRRGVGRHLGQQLAREHLVPLDLGARSRRPDRARALGQQRVDDARGQRLVGADHRDVDLLRAREGGHRPRVAHVADRVAAARLLHRLHDRRVLVPQERVQLAVLAHAHGERALTSSVTDDQRAHAAQPTSTGCARSADRHVAPSAAVAARTAGAPPRLASGYGARSATA